ncbi:MAG: carbonic anhydrase [Myxococcaceae bacterium]|nr:carbonic anhydrase [Myxococcaceae bacterium]
MSRKLLIVIAVQSALVLGLGGAALGVSMSGASEVPAHAKSKKKKAKAPPVEEDGEAEASHDDGAEEAPAKPVKKAHAAHAPEPAADEHAQQAAEQHAAAKAHEAESRGGPKKKAALAPPKPGAEPHADELHPLPMAAPKEPLEALAWLDEGNARWAQGVSRTRDLVRLRQDLAAGFSPWGLVASCADGRVVPEAVFDVPPGALVTLKSPVLKADAAFVSGLELGLRKHPAKVVVLLGHAGCDDGSGRSIEEQVTAVAGKVMGKKALREQARSGKLLVLRATYALDSGRIRWLDSEEAAHDESAHR